MSDQQRGYGRARWQAGTLPTEREAQFLRLRQAIERSASEIFDEDSPVLGAVTYSEPPPAAREERKKRFSQMDHDGLTIPGRQDRFENRGASPVQLGLA
jgi:hypothetical protein